MRCVNAVEALEMRCLPAATLFALLSQGQLSINPAHDNTEDISLTVDVVGTDLVINGPNATFNYAPIGGTLSDDYRTLTVPLSLVTSRLTINSGDGEDTIVVNSLGDSFTGDLIVNEFGAADTLIFQSGPISTSGNINVNVSTITVNAPLTVGGQMNWKSPGEDTLLTVNAAISISGSSSFVADKMAINAPIDVTQGSLKLIPNSTWQSGFASLEIGPTGDTASNTLQLSQAELDFLSAAEQIILGDYTTEMITISESIQHAADSNFQLYAHRGIVFDSGTGWETQNGNLRFEGAGTSPVNSNYVGMDLNNVRLSSSGTGSIDLIGQGGHLGSNAAVNIGIHVHSGTVIESTGTGQISLNGTGGSSLSDNRGVEISGSETLITSVAGDIKIIGQGGFGFEDYNTGVWVHSGASITSTGTAKIDITGTAGRGRHENNGVLLNGYGTNSATTISSLNGDITIIGQRAQPETGSANRGIGMYEGAVIESTGTAKITLDGTGGKGINSARGVEIVHEGTKITSVTGDITITGQGGANTSAYGVWMLWGSVVESTGTAKITIEGNGGAGSDGAGVVISGEGATTKVSSVDGDISITGQGGDSLAGAESRGMRIHSQAVIESTGTAKITLDGTGGESQHSARGVEIAHEGTRITTVTGDLTIIGQGGTGHSAIGVWINSRAVVESTESGKILIQGTGGTSGVDDLAGVYLNGYWADGPTRIATHNGDLTIIGVGSDAATGYGSRGIGMYGGGIIESTGIAKITLEGTGRSGSYNAKGLEITGAGTSITSVVGDITITGQGGSDEWGYGVGVSHGAAIVSTGTAKITIDGTGANGHIGRGTSIEPEARISSVDGDILIKGQGGNTATGEAVSGLILSAGSVIESTGTAKITLEGTAGTSLGYSRGVEIPDENTRITSAVGDITITGQGGAGPEGFGVWLRNRAIVESTATAKITIEGTGGDGHVGRGVSIESEVRISSVDGDIFIKGQGGNTATGEAVSGLIHTSRSVLESTGSAKITLEGTAGNGQGHSRGVEIADPGTLITSVVGDIQITGQGGTSEAAIGIWLRSGAVIESTDSAKILIHGTGGANGTNDSAGVYFNGWWTGGATRVSSVNGDITIIGQGSDTATSFSNRGIGMYEGGIIESTGTAKISLEGTGGTGSQHLQGIVMADAGTRVTSAVGDILINGTGGGASENTGTFNAGVWLRLGAVIESTATEGPAAKITINGTGGPGYHADIGVFVSDGSRISSHLGDIELNGQGALGTGYYNYGINIQSGSRVESTGTANIALNGTGGTGTAYSIGVLVDQSAVLISAEGDIAVTGVGGAGGAHNIGISVQSGGFIESTGGGITLHGTGGTGTDSNYGVRVMDAETRVRSVDGDLQVTGIGGTGNSINNTGVVIALGGQISSTGLGNIDVTGTGGTGTYSGEYRGGQIGVWLLDAGSRISSHDGDITVTGTGGGGTIGSDANHGVKFQLGLIETTGLANVQVTGTAGNGTYSFGVAFEGDAGIASINTSAGSGHITLIADRLEIDTEVYPAAVNAGVQSVTIHPQTAGWPIVIGAADTSTSLGLTNLELNQITAGTLIIGATTSGPLSVENDLVRQVLTNVQLISGQDILIQNGYVNTQSGSLLLQPGAGHAIRPRNTNSDVWANPITLAGALGLQINGANANSQYDQLSGYGIIDLNGQPLLLSGSYLAPLDDVFTIVNNEANQPLQGTFHDLPEGETLEFNGRLMQITYVGGDGNDIVLTRVNSAPVAQDGTLTVTEDIATSGTLPATDADGPPLTYSIVTDPSHGTLTITDLATGTYLYTPDVDYHGPDSFTFQVNDGVTDSNIATVSITVVAVTDVPRLELNGAPVTFSAKAAKKTGPIQVLPSVLVLDPDQDGLGQGTLTISIEVSAKVTKKKIKFHDQLEGLSNTASLGTTTGPEFVNGRQVLTVTLNANTTAAALQSFLRELTFKTKGAGMKKPTRLLQVQFTDAGGHASPLLEQTIIVTK